MLIEKAYPALGSWLGGPEIAVHLIVVAVGQFHHP
jgi:hypothetical protein